MVLQRLPTAVLPHVPKPLRYCDLLSDGYDRGGVDAVLALKGLFTLMLKHNLEFPRFYARLYALLSPEALQGPHRSSFALELQLLLSSTGLPAYLLAAFAKRLARLALHSTPSSAALSCGLIFNVMLQHPSVRSLVNRPIGAARPLAPEDADPFLPDEPEPEACRAVDSCLWEVDSLRSHFCPTVASLAALFAKPIERTTPPVGLAPLADLTRDALARLEARPHPKEGPLAIRKPTALFGEGSGSAGLSAWG